MSKLDQIIAATQERVALAKKGSDMQALEKMAASHVPRGFRKRITAMAQTSPAVIAELKKASPSRGVIRGTLHAGYLASQFSPAKALLGLSCVLAATALGFLVSSSGVKKL